MERVENTTVIGVDMRDGLGYIIVRRIGSRKRVGNKIVKGVCRIERV